MTIYKKISSKLWEIFSREKVPSFKFRQVSTKVLHTCKLAQTVIKYRALFLSNPGSRYTGPRSDLRLHL